MTTLEHSGAAACFSPSARGVLRPHEILVVDGPLSRVAVQLAVAADNRVALAAERRYVSRAAGRVLEPT
jgi:hypothetical protein